MDDLVKKCHSMDTKNHCKDKVQILQRAAPDATDMLTCVPSSIVAFRAGLLDRPTTLDSIDSERLSRSERVSGW